MVLKHKVVAWVAKSGNFTEKPINVDKLDSLGSCDLPELTDEQTSWMSEDFKQKFEWAWSEGIKNI